MVFVSEHIFCTPGQQYVLSCVENESFFQYLYLHTEDKYNQQINLVK
jgi:hypothetical protein